MDFCNLYSLVESVDACSVCVSVLLWCLVGGWVTLNGKPGRGGGRRMCEGQGRKPRGEIRWSAFHCVYENEWMGRA